MAKLTTLSEPDRDRVRPTMRDVAALAGVSLKTVSRVVNGEPGVSADLVSRVRRASAQLDYRPNLTASNLRRSDGQTATIGLILEDLANPFSAVVTRSVEDEARPRGVSVIAGSVDEDPVRERQLIEELLARRVDGLILAPTASDHSFLVSERRAGTPIVCVDREPAHLDADVVLAANRAGSLEGTKHMLDRGHRRIAFLGDVRTISTASERFSGYSEALDRAGIPIDERLIRRDVRTTEAAQAAVEELLDVDPPPTALFAARNVLAIGAFTALRGLGRSGDVALVGFDDFPLADLLSPAVTVVAQDPAEIGRLAAQIVFRRLDGDRQQTQRHILPTRLIARGSGEIRPPTGETPGR